MGKCVKQIARMCWHNHNKRKPHQTVFWRMYVLFCIFWKPLTYEGRQHCAILKTFSTSICLAEDSLFHISLKFVSYKSTWQQAIIRINAGLFNYQTGDCAYGDKWLSKSSIQSSFTVYTKKYAHGFCFAVLCCGYTLTDFPISIRLTSLALWQSNDCPSASKATLMNMDKYFMRIHYERLHNHNKAKHSKTVCIFLGIYCRYSLLVK